MTSNASGTPIAPAPRPKLQIAAPPRRRFGLTSILLALALVVAVGGLAFAVGRLTAPAAAASTFGAGRFGNGTANGGTGTGTGTFRGGLGGFSVSGTVTAVNGSTITVQEANGRTIDVTTSSSTTYQDATSGSASDVQNGASVIVQIDTSNGGAAGAFRGGTGTSGTVSIPASSIIVGAK